MPAAITAIHRAAIGASTLLAAAIALPAQVTSTADSLQTVRVQWDAGSAGSSGRRLPPGPMPNGYALREAPLVVPVTAEAFLTPLSATRWTVEEHSLVQLAFNHSTLASTGPHRTRLRFETTARPIAGLLSLRVTANSNRTALGQVTMQASVGGVIHGFQPGSPAVAIPVLLDANTPLDVLVDSASNVYVPRMSLTLGETGRIGLEVEVLPTPNPCRVTETGPGCGPVELDAYADARTPTRQILRIRDPGATPRIALVGAGTQVGSTGLGNHPVTGQPCTLWPALLIGQPLALDARGEAELAFDTAALLGLNLVIQAATVDPNGTASFSRGLRVRYP